MRIKVVHFKRKILQMNCWELLLSTQENSNELIIWGNQDVANIFATICLRFMTLNSAFYISLGHKTKKSWSTQNHLTITLHSVLYHGLPIYWDVRQGEQYAAYAYSKRKDVSGVDLQFNMLAKYGYTLH